MKTKAVATRIETGSKMILFMGIVLSLSGCVGMNSKFDCNVSSGGRCAPMHQIHKLADQGVFNDGSDRKLIGNSRITNFDSPQGYPLASFVGKPMRSAESIQQIWLGPYEDANGNYHEPAYIYAVVKKGSWLSEEKEMVQE